MVFEENSHLIVDMIDGVVFLVKSVENSEKLFVNIRLCLKSHFDFLDIVSCVF